jgi:hypothetical protein
MTPHLALSIVIALAASTATAAFAVSVAERLAPWITRGTAQTMRLRRRRPPTAPGGWTPLQSATVVLAAGIVLTVVLAFTLVVWLLGLAPA